MTIKNTFFIGLNDKDAKVQLIDTWAAREVVSNIFTAHKQDATVTVGHGIYTHTDGTTIQEETIIVYVFEFGTPVDIIAICEDLKKALNQESIAVERCETESNLY